MDLDTPQNERQDTEDKPSSHLENQSNHSEKKSEKPARTEEKRVRRSVKELEALLDDKEQAAKDYYDRYLRVSAEFENYQKRSTREMSDFKKFANESLIKALLPAIDSLESALGVVAKDTVHGTDVIKGIELTYKEIKRILEKFGVVSIDALGKPFDPNFHQAVMQEASDDYSEPTVIKELQKGYLIHDRLLRPAMVVVTQS